MEPKLPAFLKGEFQPRDNGTPGSGRRLPDQEAAHRSARLYAAAFAADPKLADDLKAGHRYNAACFAALAAAGQGEDAGQARRQGAHPPAAAGPRLAPRRPGPAHQATGDRQARRPRRGAAGAAPLAEGHRPGRHPRCGGAGQAAGGRKRRLREALGRRGGAVEEGRREGGSGITVGRGRQARPDGPGAVATAKAGRGRDADLPSLAIREKMQPGAGRRSTPSRSSAGCSWARRNTQTPNRCCWRGPELLAPGDRQRKARPPSGCRYLFMLTFANFARNNLVREWGSRDRGIS